MIIIIIIVIIIPVIRQSQWAQASLLRLHDHFQTHHTRQDSSGRVISLLQTPLPDNSQHSQETDIDCPWRDSNSQSQQASGRRSTPQTARPRGSAKLIFDLFNIRLDLLGTGRGGRVALMQAFFIEAFRCFSQVFQISAEQCLKQAVTVALHAFFQFINQCHIIRRCTSCLAAEALLYVKRIRSVATYKHIKCWQCYGAQIQP